MGSEEVKKKKKVAQLLLISSKGQMHLLNYQAPVHLQGSDFSVGGVHCVDVAVQLVPERQPGLGGEVDLGAPAEASGSLAVAAPGRRRGQAWLHLLYGN